MWDLFLNPLGQTGRALLSTSHEVIEQTFTAMNQGCEHLHGLSFFLPLPSDGPCSVLLQCLIPLSILHFKGVLTLKTCVSRVIILYNHN